MKSNILKALTDNLGFKLLALFFAFTLWLTVYNLEDPTKSKTMTLPVVIENRENLENMGKYFEVLEGSNKASFTITAARSVLDKLDESDFVATADMNQIAIAEDNTIGTVPIEITCTANVNEKSYKLSSTSKNLKISIEDLMSKQFVVSVKPTGNLPEGFTLGSIEVTAPNVLRVSGPKSIVQTIDSVVASVDVSVSGIVDSKNTYKATPELYDKNGKEIDATRLTLSNSTVTVLAEVLNTKQVPISVKASGSPADGYTLTKVNCNPKTLLLKGDKAVLNTINVIEVPSSLLSVEGKDQNVEVTIDVSEYIPQGVSLVNPEESTVKITATIGKIKEKVFSIDAKNILVTGLSTQSKLEFAVASIAVYVSGLEADIAKLGNKTISGSIDVTNLKNGTHEVEVDLDLDDTMYNYLPVKVTVNIVETSLPEENLPAQ